MEPNDMEVVNDNASYEKADVEMEYQYEKDNECKEEKQGSRVSLSELTEKCCDTIDEPLEINKQNSFDKNNTNIVTSAKLKKLSNENNENGSTADLIQSQFESCPSYGETSVTENIPELNDFLSHDLEAEQNFEFIFKQTENFDLSFDETNIISPSFSDSPFTDSFSYSLYSTSLSNPSGNSNFSYLLGTSNKHSEYNLTNEEDLLFNYLEKASNDNLEPISATKKIKTKEYVENFVTMSLITSNPINNTLEKKKLMEYNILQYILDNVKCLDNNKMHSNSECFVEDKIIINPDVMYNIELKLYLKKIELLAEQISKTPDDLMLLNKCMELMSIPEIKNRGQVITNECTPFSEDIPESNDYNIQHKDWNKIIASQDAVQSYIKFDLNSKDILYLMKDEAINHTKQLAGIMEKNIDIQSKSSSLSSIDPIQKSLQEMGVAELIKHYENDVFGRRNRLLKKCEHFQSTINQFVKHFITPTVKNKYDIQEFLVEEQSTNKINVLEENLLTEEKASTSTESDHIDNINTFDIYNREMYFNTDVKCNDLLKFSHMLTVPSNSKSNSFKSKKSFLNTNNLCKQQSEKSNNLLKAEKLFDASESDNIFDPTENNIKIDVSKIQSTSTLNKIVPSVVKSIGLDKASFQKIVDEFNENFDHESVYDNRSP